MTGDSGNLPLAVLTAARLTPTSAGSRRRGPQRYRYWLVLQDELAALSTNSTHVTADYGGHHLNRDNPDRVTEVLSDLVRRVRSPKL